MLGCVCSRYVSFVSQTVYQESTSHLSELVHKSDNMLGHLVRRNRTLLHLWNDCMKNDLSEEQIRASLNEMQKETGCAALYFLASDGSCMTPDGERGSLGSQVDLNEPFSNGEDIVLNAALPGKPQMLVFICPETQGTYRGFAYDALAIAYYNNVVLNALDNTAFGGAAHSYVIYPDGRVVLDSSADSDDPVYNLLAELREHSDLTGEKLDALSADLAQGRNGSRMLTLHGTRYYLVYESTGIQDWTILSLVPVSIVNASMNRLWFRTVEIVVAVMVLLAVLIIVLILRRSRAASDERIPTSCTGTSCSTGSRTMSTTFSSCWTARPRTRTISARTSSVCSVCRSNRCGRTSISSRRCTKRTPPDRDRNFLEGLQRGEQREWDTDYVHQETGERRWFHIVAMGTEAAGRTKYILVLSDRTADREVNQALSDAVAAAQSASRAKSDFLTNMSHDIRTPMNAIIGFTTLAVSNISDTERVRDYLTKTLASSRHLLSLINDILDMSRIESGRLHLEESEVSLSEVLHDIKTIVGGQVHAKQLELYMDALDVTDEDVCCDRTRLEQILLNLLSNAVKFTPAGGTVSVRVRQLAGTQHGCAQYEFRVRDTGIGMSAAFAKAYLRAVRARAHLDGQPHSGHRPRHGHHPEHRRHDGRHDRGADRAGPRHRVHRLPADARADRAALRGKDRGARRTQGARRRRRFQHLRQRDQAADPRGDARRVDALRPGGRACARQSIELGDPCRAYIIDWRLPDMNGIEVTRQIRSLNDDTPIIILTAYDWSDIEVEARAAGVTAFCSKPMFLSDLRDTLLTAIGHAAPAAAEPDVLPGSAGGLPRTARAAGRGQRAQPRDRGGDPA